MADPVIIIDQITNLDRRELERLFADETPEDRVSFIESIRTEDAGLLDPLSATVVLTLSSMKLLSIWITRRKKKRVHVRQVSGDMTTEIIIEIEEYSEASVIKALGGLLRDPSGTS